MSLPPWERGLKLTDGRTERRHSVAPSVGAWIETELRRALRKNVTVAPSVGAWIETPTLGHS